MKHIENKRKMADINLTIFITLNMNELNNQVRYQTELKKNRTQKYAVCRRHILDLKM